jgi:hypothetical protein
MDILTAAFGSFQPFLFRFLAQIALDDKPVPIFDEDAKILRSIIAGIHNTKKYRRSSIESRVGRSPVEILTSKQWPELIELLEERGFWAEQTAKEVA